MGYPCCRDDMRENSLCSGTEIFRDPILRLKSADRIKVIVDQNGNCSTNDEITSLRSYALMNSCHKRSDMGQRYQIRAKS